MASWCCNTFSELLKYDMSKGFSIFASKQYGSDSFFLQACPFEKEELAEFPCIDTETGLTKFPGLFISGDREMPLNIQVTVAIKYCMFCGKKLEKVIRKNQKEFDSLAENHLRLVKKYFSGNESH